MVRASPALGAALEQAAAGSTVETPDQVVRPGSSQERIMHS